MSYLVERLQKMSARRPTRGRVPEYTAIRFTMNDFFGSVLRRQEVRLKESRPGRHSGLMRLLHIGRWAGGFLLCFLLSLPALAEAKSLPRCASRVRRFPKKKRALAENTRRPKVTPTGQVTHWMNDPLGGL